MGGARARRSRPRMRAIRRGRSRIFCVSGARAAVEAGEQRQPRARMSGRHARKKMQVIVDDRVGDRLACEIHDARSRHAQQHQQAQHPLFVMMDARDLGEHVGIQAEAGKHDDGARRGGVGKDLAEHPGQRLLEPRELGPLLG